MGASDRPQIPGVFEPSLLDPEISNYTVHVPVEPESTSGSELVVSLVNSQDRVDFWVSMNGGIDVIIFGKDE